MSSFLHTKGGFVRRLDRTGEGRQRLLVKAGLFFAGFLQGKALGLLLALAVTYLPALLSASWEQRLGQTSLTLAGLIVMLSLSLVLLARGGAEERQRAAIRFRGV